MTDRGDLRRGVAKFEGEGRRAVTHFRVVERFGPVASLVACWLETGRTHQIRIHLAEMGHPVVGEAVYRPRSQPSCKARFHRQALHAQTLGFVHPILGHKVRVEAALPTDMDDLIVDLRNRYGIEGAGRAGLNLVDRDRSRPAPDQPEPARVGLDEAAERAGRRPGVSALVVQEERNPIAIDHAWRSPIRPRSGTPIAGRPVSQATSAGCRARTGPGWPALRPRSGRKRPQNGA